MVPVLDYCGGVTAKIKICSKIQNKAVKYYLGVHQKWPLFAIGGIIGWNSCNKRRCKTKLIQWNHENIQQWLWSM